MTTTTMYAVTTIEVSAVMAAMQAFLTVVFGVDAVATFVWTIFEYVINNFEVIDCGVLVDHDLIYFVSNGCF